MGLHERIKKQGLMESIVCRLAWRRFVLDATPEIHLQLWVQEVLVFNGAHFWGKFAEPEIVSHKQV